jgi:8-oxo-dGTP pyrophosphatase MutT (NUDIX family)
VVEGRFVPAGVALDAVDAAWARVQAALPHAHDGPMLHVLGTSRNGHGGVTVHCVASSYRFHAVAREGVDTGMRPLGVKAITFAPEGRVLVARRSERTLNYPGRWEFAPAGTLEPGVAPAEMILRELREETGWAPSAPPVPRALMFDPVARSWELVFAIDAEPPAVPVESWECDAVQAVAPDAWPGPMSDAAMQMMPVLEAELRARR